MKKFHLLLLAVFFSVMASAQITATTYPFSTSAAAVLEDMSSGTTELLGPASDDGNSTLVGVIGFDFWFNGERFNVFGVNANGVAKLGAVTTGTSFTNSIATTANEPKLMPFWDDLCTGFTGKVHYKMTGAAPNRKLIVEWQNMQITRGAGCAGVGTGTFQIWLFETTGVIEFVYGAGMIATQAVDGGYSIGIQSGAATNFASITTSTGTVSYVAANNTQTNAIAAGTKYTFTPLIPLAPTGINFTAVTAVGMTVNWTDNATNEIGYAIFRSDDGGLNYNFITLAAAGATSSIQGGLSPTATYFWRVYAVTQGAVSTELQGSQTTNAAGNITSLNTGLWSAPATWSSGSVPTASDNVTIANGHTVTIDIAAEAFTVTVGQGSSGVLEFEETTARTITVGSNTTIASGAAFRSNAAGTQTGHVLSSGGNLTNNGTLDFSTNGNNAGAGIIFTNLSPASFSFSPTSTTDLRQATGVTINNNEFLSFTPRGTITVEGANADGFLAMTKGAFRLTGTVAYSNPVFNTPNYIIPANSVFWMDNANATVAGQNGSPTNNGELFIAGGTYNIGTSSGNAMGAGTGAFFRIEGGTVNISGRLNTANVVTYIQNGGIVNVCTVGNGSSLSPSFGLTNTASVFQMNSGTINLVQINSTATAANRRDYNVAASDVTITGGTLNIGTAATTGNAGNFDFRIQGQVPGLTVNNTTNNKHVILTSQLNTWRNVLVNAGTSINTQSNVWLVNGSAITNNGSITLPTSGARFYFMGSGPQTYAGSGTTLIETAAGSVDLTMDNPAGLTINPASNGIITQRVNFFRGGITNSNKITLGNGGATVGVVQYGLTGGVNTAGNFDVAPTFNIGTGGQTLLYAQEPTPRTTSVEIPPSRTIVNASVNNTNGVILAGGDLNFAPTLATSTLTFTVGNLTTNANTVIISATSTVARSSGHVIGNLRKFYSAAGLKIFEVGTANGYSPVGVNAIAGTFPGDFTVSAVQGKLPQIGGTDALQRYWPLSNNITGLTANLAFNYLPTDVVGNLANYVFVKHNLGTLTQVAPAAAPTTTQAVVNGVSSFSDWTLADPAALIPVNFTITASAGAGGTISPSGAVVVTSGNNQAFTITPNTCFQVADVLVDGVSVGAVLAHTFTNVTANHTIAVSFSAVTPPSTPTITPGGPTTFCPGGSVTLTSSSPSGNQWYESGNPIGGETNQTYVATTAGSYTVVVTSLGCSSAPSAPVTVTINPAPVVVNPVVASGIIGTPFSQSFSQTGGTAPVAFSTGSAIPAGLTLSAAGVLSGTPTVTGTFPIIVSVTDANTCVGTGATYNLVINCPPSGNFYDGFESGSYTPTWTLGPGLTSGAVTTTNPAAGLYRLEGTGGELTHMTGFSTIIPAATPSSISWYIFPTGAGSTNYFVGGDNTLNPSNNIFFCFWQGNTSTIRFVGGNGFITYDHPATPGQWYHIELRNIDWSARTFDIWIDNVQVQTGFPFRSLTQNNITRLHLYNYNNGVGVWDDILLGTLPPPVATPSSQTICTGTAITPIVLSGASPGATYNWSRDNTVAITGIAASGTGNISGTLTNTTNAPVLVTFTIIPDYYGTCAQAPYTATVLVNPNNTTGTGGTTACINTPFGFTFPTTGATGIANAGIPGANGLPPGVAATWALNVLSVNGTATAAGTFNYSIPLTGGCGTVSATGTITITPDNTILLTSAAGTIAQTVLVNTPITNITYATTGATGATFMGLPPGVTGMWAGNVVTISGTPTTIVGSPFGYTVTLTGGCGTVTATGTITVINCTITLTSAPATAAQSVCNNSPITNITYATTVATGASFAGLPAGVTGAWASNVATISGTPTTPGTFNYTVTLTGGVCGAVTATGTITVNPNPVVSIIPPGPTTICAGTNLTLTASATCNRFAFSGLLRGSQEVPPNASTARGLFYGTLNATTNQLTFTVIFDGLTGGAANAAHIHNAPVGANGPIIVPFPGFPAATSGTYTNTFTLTAANAALLLAGNTYVNIHNATFPGGELRGQITNLVTNGYTIAGPMNGTMEVPPNASTATGNFAGTYNDATNQVMINVIFNNLTGGNATAAHIHTGAAGFNGPVIIPFAGFPAATSGSYSLTAAVPAANLAGFLAGNTYVNIHNAVFPGGEIRGQVAPPAAICATNTYLWSPGGATTQSITVSTANTYTVTVTDGNNCSGSASTVVNVNPVPVGSASPQTICSGGTTSVTLNSTTPAGGTTYSYTAAIQTTPTGGTITGQGNGTANPIAQTLTNTGTTFGVIRYTVTPSYTNAGVTCAGTAFTVDVTVNPIPVGSASPQTICSGGVTSVTLNSTTPAGGTTWSYTAAIQTTPTGGTITGQGSGTANPIAQTLTNTGTSPGVVRYTVTPSYTNAGVTCAGTAFTVDITVNPIPTVNAVANLLVCNGSPVAVSFTGTVPGTVYNWTNTAPSIGIAASGSGNLAFNAINPGIVPVTATIVVTPTFTNAGVTCTGTPTTFTITVGDTQPPIILCPNSVTVTANNDGSCTATGVVLGNATATDNCPGLITITNNAPAVFPVGVTVVTWTATDAVGNSSTCSKTVTVIPFPGYMNQPPSQTVCANTMTAPVNFSSTPPIPGVVYSWTNNNTSIGLAAAGTGNIPGFTAINNSSSVQVATITVTPVTACPGSTNTPSTFTITVNPKVMATITGAPVTDICNGQTATVNLNLQGLPVFNGVLNLAVIAGTGTPTTINFSSNTAGPTTVTIPATSLENLSAPLTTYRITLLALTDNSYCPVTLAGSVDINVHRPLVITVSNGPGTVCPGSVITFNVTSGQSGAFNWQAHDGNSVIASGNNVAFGTNAVNYTTLPCPYNKTLTFTFTPVGGFCPGGASVTRTVVVQDLTPPAFTVTAALQNTTIECSNTAAIAAARNYAPTATDNCDSSPTVTEIETVVNGCGGSKVYTTVFTAIDDCGNTSTSTQTITVTDTTPPVIGPIAPQTLGCAGVMPNYITLLGLQFITTDCGPVILFEQLAPYAPGTPLTGLSGTITITIRATDGCGNQSTKTFTVTLTPGAPTAVCKSSSPTIFVNLLPNGTATIQPSLIDGGSFSNCSTITMSLSPSTFTCANIGVNAVTLTVTDAAGNTAQCTTNVTVRDVTAPSMTACPGNITLTAGANCSATATWTPPTATDNCGNPTVTGTHTPGQSFNAGVTTVTYTATDASGNSVTCSFTVTVLDTQAPTIICPANINVNTNAANCRASVQTPNPTVTDNCPTTLQWTITGATNSSGTGNLGTFLFNVGTSVVTYRVTDGSGNSATCSYVVVVTNAVAGAISGTATVQQHPVNTSPVTFTGSGGQSPYTFSYTINGTPQPPVTSVGNTAMVQQSNAALGSFAYQLTGVTDANGCAGTITAPNTATIMVVVAGVPDLIVIPVQSSSQIAPGGTIQEVFTIKNIGTGPTTGPVTFTVNRFAPGAGLTATLNTALSVNIGFDNFTLHNNNEAGWSVVTTASTFTFTYTGVIAAGAAGSKNVGVTVTRGGPPIQGANGMTNQTATIPGGTGGGESPTSNNSATVTIVKN